MENKRYKSFVKLLCTFCETHILQVYIYMHFSGSVPGNYNYSTVLLFSCFLCFLLRRFSNDIHSISRGKNPTAPLTWSHPRVPHKLSQQSRQSACSALSSGGHLISCWCTTLSFCCNYVDVWQISMISVVRKMKWDNRKTRNASTCSTLDSWPHLCVGFVLQKTKTRPSRGWIPCKCAIFLFTLPSTNMQIHAV